MESTATNLKPYEFEDERVTKLQSLYNSYFETMNTESYMNKVEYIKKLYSYIYENAEYFFNIKNDRFYNKSKTGKGLVSEMGKSADRMRAEIRYRITSKGLETTTDTDLMEIMDCYFMLGKVEAIINKYLQNLRDNDLI